MIQVDLQSRIKNFDSDRLRNPVENNVLCLLGYLYREKIGAFKIQIT